MTTRTALTLAVITLASLTAGQAVHADDNPVAAYLKAIKTDCENYNRDFIRSKIPAPFITVSKRCYNDIQKDIDKLIALTAKKGDLTKTQSDIYRMMSRLLKNSSTIHAIAEDVLKDKTAGRRESRIILLRLEVAGVVDTATPAAMRQAFTAIEKYRLTDWDKLTKKMK